MINDQTQKISSLKEKITHLEEMLREMRHGAKNDHERIKHLEHLVSRHEAAFLAMKRRVH